MNISCYVENLEELKSFAKIKDSEEIILAPKKLSRYGQVSINDMMEIAKEAKALKLKVSLEFDRILVGFEFDPYINEIKDLDYSNIDTIRVIDPGLAEYFLCESEHKIQWIAEMGNHNLKALKEWEKYFSDRLDKIILCPELDKNKVTEFCQKLDTKCELLAFGRILLFYTPRLLLKPYFIDHDDPEQKNQLSDEFLKLSANSEESPHRGFSIIETNSGTYMFNPKDLNLLNYFEDLKASGLHNIRIDFRSTKQEYKPIDELETYIDDRTPENLENLKSKWDNGLIRGFFGANKSDVLFKNLKNIHNQREDKNFIGDILETESGKHCVLEVKSTQRTLSIGDKIQYKTPDKKWKEMRITKMRSLWGEEIESAAAGNFVVLPHSSGVSSNTRVYWQEN